MTASRSRSRLALNFANITTDALIADGADITTGNLNITATSVGETNTKAVPNDDVVGKKFGMGASVALGFITDRAMADIANGVVLLLLGVGAIMNIIATGGNSSTTTAQAGAGSTGITLVPAVALTISNVSRRAQIGTGSTILNVGSLTVAGRAPPATNTVITTAEGSSTSSGSAAVGVSLALAFVNHDVSATTKRNIDASGAVTIDLTRVVTFEAIGQSAVTTTRRRPQRAQDKNATQPGGAGNVDGQVVRASARRPTRRQPPTEAPARARNATPSADHLAGRHHPRGGSDRDRWSSPRRPRRASQPA